MGKAYIGTSGFSYPHWGNGVFYPKGLAQNRWLEYYARHFRTVEINVSFYRLPKKETFERWKKVVEGREGKEGSSFAKASEDKKEFVFSVKGWRWVTHVRRLKNCERELGMFFERVGGLLEDGKWGWEVGRESGNEKQEVSEKQNFPPSLLASRLASHFSPSLPTVILWQLPPSLKVDIPRLEKFLAMLPDDYRHAFEFRDESWMEERVKRVIEGKEGKEGNKAVVFQDYPEWPKLQEVWPDEGITGNFVYLRFHGREALYTSGYTSRELNNWADRIKRWLKRGLDVYVYFNNDALGYAVENAIQLKQLIKF